MFRDEYLMLPGPTMVPGVVRQEMARPMINHRGPEFGELYRRVTRGLAAVMETMSEVLVFPAAGTGALEAAVVNLFSPGDRVLVVDAGVFGSRFAQIARVFGLEVETVTVEWGQAVDPELIGARLARDKAGKIKAVFITHNETSTGVTQDIRAVSAARGDHPALLVVDAVSSLGALPLPMDEWRVDVVLAGSQKALMCPPGLAVFALSDRAWQATTTSTCPRYYWDFQAARSVGAKGQTPYTPALSLFFALGKSLELIESEGLARVFRRHAILGQATRQGIAALGLELYAKPGAASDTVTAVRVPASLEVRELRKRLRGDFGVIVAGGQQSLEDKIIRIGHLGQVAPLDIIATLAALEMVLFRVGQPVDLGAGVAAAQRILAEGEK